METGRIVSAGSAAELAGTSMISEVFLGGTSAERPGSSASR
jgi:hypothetical protein